MRVLMTGGYGCIGSWVAKQLVERGEEVWIFDLQEDTHRLGLLLDAEPMARVHFLPGDVSDPVAVDEAVAERRGDPPAPPGGAANPDLPGQPDPRGPRQRDRHAGGLRSGGRPQGQVERVVYASSAAVHGPAEPGAAGPIGDEVRLAPMTHYGAYKVCNELNARVYWLDQGITSVGLRPWTVYGVGRDFGMTSEPTKAIKAVAAGRPYRISYGGSQDLQYVARRRRDLPPRPDRARSRGPTRSTSAASVVPIETFVDTLARGRPGSRPGSSPTATGTPDRPRPRRLPARQPASARSPARRSATGIAETYAAVRQAPREGRLELSDLA